MRVKVARAAGWSEVGLEVVEGPSGVDGCWAVLGGEEEGGEMVYLLVMRVWGNVSHGLLGRRRGCGMRRVVEYGRRTYGCRSCF